MRPTLALVASLAASGCAAPSLVEGAWRMTVVGVDDSCATGVTVGVDVLADLSWVDDTLYLDLNGGNVVGAAVEGDAISYVVDGVGAVGACDLGQHVEGRGLVVDPTHFTLTEVTDWVRDGGQCGEVGVDLPCRLSLDFEAELAD